MANPALNRTPLGGACTPSFGRRLAWFVRRHSPAMRTTIFMQVPGAKRKAVVVSVSVPRSDPLSKSGDKRVFLEGPGIPSRLPVHGIDGIQAAALAFTLLRNSVEALAKSGVEFYLTRRGNTKVDLSAIWFGASGHLMPPNLSFNTDVPRRRLQRRPSGRRLT